MSQMTSSSDEGDDIDSDERCFQRDVLNAIERNNYDELHRLLDTDRFDINSVINTRDGNNKNNTLLHMALKKRKRHLDTNDSKKIINLLIKKGANINIANDLGETPYRLFNKRLKTGVQSTDWISLQSLFPSNQPSCSSKGHSNNNHINKKDIKYKNILIPPTSQHHDFKMDCDESLFYGNPTYNASGLKYSLHGVVYQLQLLMLFVHRATKAYASFSLATEINEAEKFDDVVLKYKISERDSEWTWRFLQAKHLSNVSANRINKSQLFSLNEKLPFSLHKYFLSFCKIKLNRFFIDSYLKDFIICTNAELDPSATMYFTEDKCSKGDKILFFKTFTFKVYKLHTCAKTKLITNYQTKLQHSPDNRYLNEFLEKFRFITKFPNENQLNRLITGELGTKYGLLNAELVTNTFKNHILKWLMSYKNGSSEYLLIRDGKKFLKLIEQQIRTLMTAGLSIAYPEKLLSYGICFRKIPEYVKKFLLNDNIQILHLESNSTLLTSIKIAESLQYVDQCKTRDSFIFVTRKHLLLDNIRNLILDSFSSSTSHNLLVITLEASENAFREILSQFYSKLFIILSDHSFKKVITITSLKNIHEVNEITDLGLGNNFMKLEDINTFQDLDDTSQENVLNKEILFQEKYVPLNELINKFSAYNVIDESILTKILKDEEDIYVDKCNLRPFELSTLYLPRTLSRRKIRSHILLDFSFITNNTIFLTGVSEKNLADMNVSKYKLYVFKDNEMYENGIVLPPKYTTNEINYQIFQNLSQSNDNKNIYWIEYQDGNLAWENFNGNDITLKKFIDEKADIDCIREENLPYFKELNKKIYIIGGEPGMGKSAFTANLKRSLKNNDPLYWIIRINLNEYSSSYNRAAGYKSLEDIIFSEWETDKAIHFMLDIINPEDSSKSEINFQRKLLEFALKNCSNTYKYPMVIIIFDGFDEISPTYKEKTLVLLKALRQSSILQMWITTRTHEIYSLEQELKSPALILNAFNNEQKIKYVENIFQEYTQFFYSTVQTDALCKYLEEIKLNSHEREETNNSFRDSLKMNSDSLITRLEEALDTNFTNNPLHLRMVAEIMSNNKNDLANNINLLSLYLEFANTKFDIYYDQKSIFSGSVAASEMRQRDLRILRNIHQRIALKELFPTLNKEQNTQINKCELVRVGFLVLDSQSGIKFVHRSFAEYFFSDYLDENFEDPDVRHVLIKCILSKTEFSFIRKFLNNHNDFLFKLENTEHNIFEITAGDWLFDVAIFENNKNILKCLLINAKTNYCSVLKDIKTKLYDLNISSLTDTRRQILILVNVILFDIEVFVILFKDIIKHKDFLKNFCRDGSCLHIWAIFYSGSNSVQILDRICTVTIEHEELPDDHAENRVDIYLRIISKLLSQECFKGESVLHKIAARGRFDLIQDLILWVKQKTNNNDAAIKNLLYMVNRDKQTFLHVLACNSTLHSFLTFMFQNFDTNTLKNLILLTDSWGRTILHYYVANILTDCEALNAFLTIFQQNFDRQTITDILFKTAFLGKTALHCVTKVGEDNESFRLLLKFSISYLEPEKCKELLLLTDDDGRSVLHNAAYYDIALGELIEFCKNSFTQKVFESFMFSLDINDQSVLHNVVENFNTSKALIVLLDSVKTYFGLNELKKLMMKTDVYGQTVFHHACSNHGETVEKLLSYTETNFDLETVKTLIVQQDINGLTGIHYAAQNIFRNAISALLNFAKARFDIGILTDLILASDLNDQNVLHYGAKNDINFRTLEVLLEFLKENCDIHVVFRGLLFKQDGWGNTPLDIAKHKRFFRPIYKWFINKLGKNNRTVEDIKHNIIFTRLEVHLLYLQIDHVFDHDQNEQMQLIEILEQYLDEFPVNKT